VFPNALPKDPNRVFLPPPPSRSDQEEGGRGAALSLSKWEERSFSSESLFNPFPAGE